jgi:flagellin
MRELGLQAMNGTYNDDQRKHMNEEYKQLSSHIDSISSTTSYNQAFPFTSNLNPTPGLIGSTGNPRFNISWNENIDLDPVIVDPAGDSMGYNTSIAGVDSNADKNTTSSGGIWDVDDTGGVGPNQENFAWPDKAGLPGNYQVYIRGFNGPYAFDVNITVNYFVNDVQNTAAITLPAGTRDIGPFTYNLDPKQSNGIIIPTNTESITDTNKLVINRTVVNSNSLGIASRDLLTQDNAEKAVNAVDAGMTILKDFNSYYGFTYNALEHVLNNNDTTDINLRSANSQIKDADMAKEFSILAASQLRESAGVNMFSYNLTSIKEVTRLLVPAQ